MSRPYSCNPSHQRPRLVQRQVDFFIRRGEPAQNKALHGHGAGKWKGRQKFSTSLGIVRSNTVASGNRAL